MTCAMAIPFNLPSDEETEDNYRRLDQLLLDLYQVLRQILVRPLCNHDVPAAVATRREERGDRAPAPTRPRPEVESDATRSRQPDLPDVVASTLSSCQCARRAQPQQRRHRRRRRPSCCPVEPVVQPAAPPVDLRRVENWLVIGEQLRKIAEEFKTSFVKQEVTREREENVKLEVKSSGLFSLLVPTHLRTSIWTTVILLVGWRLLVRSR